MNGAPPTQQASMHIVAGQKAKACAVITLLKEERKHGKGPDGHEESGHSDRGCL